MPESVTHRNPLTSSRLLCLLLLTLALHLPTAYADDDASDLRIPTLTDLSRDALQSRRQRAPILLLVSRSHCGYCERLKQDILYPMLKAGDFAGQLIMRELIMDGPDAITDLEGSRLSAGVIAERYAVNLTPTLLLLGPDGVELTQRITGYYTPEMFFFYVDQAIRKAIDILQQRQGGGRDAGA